MTSSETPFTDEDEPIPNEIDTALPAEDEPMPNEIDTTLPAEDEPAPTEIDTTLPAEDEPVPTEIERPRRRINPVALVIGILYVALGLGVIADHEWGGVDLGAIAGTSAVVAGVMVIALLIARR